jgi:hypothetical protein
VTTVFLEALTIGAGALAAAAAGLAGVVAAVFIAAAGTVVAAFVREATPVVCVPAALTGEPAVAVEVPMAVEVPAAVDVPPAAAAGAQGAALAVLVAAALGAAGAAAFFFPKSAPRLEIAAVAFDTAALALAGTWPFAEFVTPARVVPAGPQGGKPWEATPCPWGKKAVACPGAAADTPLARPR